MGYQAGHIEAGDTLFREHIRMKLAESGSDLKGQDTALVAEVHAAAVFLAFENFQPSVGLEHQRDPVRIVEGLEVPGLGIFEHKEIPVSDMGGHPVDVLVRDDDLTIHTADVSSLCAFTTGYEYHFVQTP
jgi:hypothetical protein